MNVKELLANEAIYILQQIGDVCKTLEINISSTCVKPCNGNVEHVG